MAATLERADSTLRYEEIGGWIEVRDKYGRIDIQLHSVPGYVYLWSFSVKEKYQHKGHGKRILSAAIEYAARRGRGCMLNVEANNERAIRMYENAGFIKVDDGLSGACQYIHVMRRERTRNEGDPS